VKFRGSMSGKGLCVVMILLRLAAAGSASTSRVGFLAGWQPGGQGLPREAKGRLAEFWVGSTRGARSRMPWRPGHALVWDCTLSRAGGIGGQSLDVRRSGVCARVFGSGSAMLGRGVLAGMEQGSQRSSHTRASASLSTSRRLDYGDGLGGMRQEPFRHLGPDCTAALVAELQHCRVLPKSEDATKLSRLLSADSLVYALAQNLGIASSPDDPWTHPSLLLAAAHMHKVRITCIDETFSEQVFDPPRGLNPRANIILALRPDGFYGASSTAPIWPGTDPSDGQLWIFFDLETTGLSTDADHVTQIAASAYHTPSVQGSSVPPAAAQAILRGHFNCMVKPGVPVSPGAAQVTGFTTEMLEGYPSFREQGRLFVDWATRVAAESGCSKPILVAHNGNRFDFPLLRNELARHEIDAPIVNQCILFDTLLYFRSLPGSQSNRLGELYEARFGRPMSNAHDARADVAGLAKITLSSDRPASSEQLSDDDASVVPEELQACEQRLSKLMAFLSAKGVRMEELFASQSQDSGSKWSKSKRNKPTQPLSLLFCSCSSGSPAGGTRVQCIVQGLEPVSTKALNIQVESSKPGKTSKSSSAAVKDLCHVPLAGDEGFSVVTLTMPPGNGNVTVTIFDDRPKNLAASFSYVYD